MTARRAVLLAGVVVGVVLVALAVPVATGLYPVAQVVSFRAVLGLGALFMAILLFAVPGTRRTLLPLTLAFAVGAAAQSAVLIWRSVPHEAADAVRPDHIVVLAFNTMSVVRAKNLADLVDAQDADVVVLPETDDLRANRLGELLDQRGRHMRVFSTPSHLTGASDTSVLVDERLVENGTSTPLATRFGSMQIHPADPVSGLVLVGTHTGSPGSRSAMDDWRHDTALIAQTCATTPGVIVAGDLNATLDHPGLSDLGPCVDAAREVGQASHGTWPSWAPSVLAAPIDHVLVDGRAWRVVGFSVLGATGGSDHRPIVATLERR